MAPLVKHTPFQMLLMLAAFALPGCDAELYHGLSERQANQAVLALREAGLAADKRAEGRGATQSFVVTVPAGEETRALRLLEERGLPRRPPPRPTRGLLPLPEEQRQQQALELADQLVVTLESLPEVQEARVHLSLPPEDPLRPGASLAPAAAVLLHLRQGAGLPQTDVAQLVARAVPGLDPQRVSVLHAVAPPRLQAEPALVRVGPLWVAAESRRWASALLALCLLLAAAVLWLLVRRRRA
ncbi:MAG: hypothetical protein NZ890_10065 [Myxococcota bacterium]|nr:hypothetical protein [Myxococcota bacterium]